MHCHQYADDLQLCRALFTSSRCVSGYAELVPDRGNGLDETQESSPHRTELWLVGDSLIEVSEGQLMLKERHVP